MGNYYTDHPDIVAAAAEIHQAIDSDWQHVFTREILADLVAQGVVESVRSDRQASINVYSYLSAKDHVPIGDKLVPAANPTNIPIDIHDFVAVWDETSQAVDVLTRHDANQYSDTLDVARTDARRSATEIYQTSATPGAVGMQQPHELRQYRKPDTGPGADNSTRQHGKPRRRPLRRWQLADPDIGPSIKPGGADSPDMSA